MPAGPARGPDCIMADPVQDLDLAKGAQEIVSLLQAAGFQTFWAGGCVRDWLLGRPAKDFDIATQARPDQVQALLPLSHAVGRAFGVILVEHRGRAYEVATFRKDERYEDGRHPSVVHFAEAKEDASRRDFTINGMFLDPSTGEVHDYVGGRADLDARLVRAIGDPAARFAEDHLRMLRAVRFAATLDFYLDTTTADAIRNQAGDLRRISAERIQGELIRILTEAQRPGQAVELLRTTGLLAVILPEVVALQGVQQPPEFHPEGDVYRHTLRMLDLLVRPSPVLALAVLLHDIGKPACQQRVLLPDGSERIRFDRHAEVGAQIAENILQRLRCSRILTEQVVTCVRRHMRFLEVTRMRPATLRRMIMAPTFATELELHRVDCLGSHGKLDHYEFVRAFAERLRNEPVRPAPLLTGRDLLALGLPAGPAIRRWLEAAYDLQLEGRFNSRPEALEWLRHQVKADAATPWPPPGRAAD